VLYHSIRENMLIMHFSASRTGPRDKYPKLKEGPKNFALKEGPKKHNLVITYQATNKRLLNSIG
jgi:hypothetical protein